MSCPLLCVHYFISMPFSKRNMGCAWIHFGHRFNKMARILACYRYSEIPRHALHESSAELSLPDAAGAANAGPLKHFRRFVCNKVTQQSSPLNWCKRIKTHYITFTLKNVKNLHPKSTAISTSAVLLLLCCISVGFGPWVAHVEVATVVCVQDGLQFAGAALSHFTNCSNSKPFSLDKIDWFDKLQRGEAGQCRTADFNQLLEIEISTVPARLDWHLANVFSSCFFQATNDIGSWVSQDLLG